MVKPLGSSIGIIYRNAQELEDPGNGSLTGTDAACETDFKDVSGFWFLVYSCQNSTLILSTFL